MLDKLSLVVDIAYATSADVAFGLAMTEFARLGFSRSNYGFTRFRSSRSVGDPDDALFLSTCDTTFLHHYFRGKFYSRTPVYHWAMVNEGATTWSFVRQAMMEGRLTPDEMATVAENQRLGVTAGITISFPSNSTRSKGALGLIADKGLTEADVERIWAKHSIEIEAVAHVLHLKLMQFPITTRGRQLTPRQREALEWVADGKTMQDVALLLGVSAAMVEKHLRLAREVLSVETTTQAVAKATLMNLIYQRPISNPTPIAAAG